MASVSESRFAGVLRELFSTEIYKRSQGRRMRQMTAAGLGLFVLWGLYSLSVVMYAARPTEWLLSQWIWVAYGVPATVGALFGWAIFRIYNWPRFADFLIATEAEMTKVSWSTRSELLRATIVVLLTLFLLSGFLLSVDLAWSWILERIGVLQPRSTVIEESASLDWDAIRLLTDYLTHT
jgi:preprotein translocase subunit SecE